MGRTGRDRRLACAVVTVVAAAVCSASACPATATEFGVCAQFDQGVPLARVDDAVDLGSRWVRSGGPAFGRDGASVGVTAEFSRQLDAFRAAGLKTLVPLAGDAPVTEEERRAYAAFVAEVVAAGEDRIDAVEIGNEWNSEKFAGAAFVGQYPGGYVELVRAVRAELDRRGLGVTLVAGATLHVTRWQWRTMLKAGLCDAADAVSVHPYRVTAEAGGRDVAWLRRELDAAGYGDVELWVTECGRDFAQKPEWERLTAAYLGRCLPLYARDADKVFVYALPETWEPAMALVGADGRRRFAFDVCRRFFGELAGAEYLGRAAGDLRVEGHRFRRADGETRTFFWGVAGMPPVGVSLSGGADESVTTVSLTGTRRAFGDGDLLAVSPLPRIVEGDLTAYAVPFPRRVASFAEDFDVPLPERWTVAAERDDGARFPLEPTNGPWGTTLKGAGEVPEWLAVSGETLWPAERDGVSHSVVIGHRPEFEGPYRLVGTLERVWDGGGGIEVCCEGRSSFAGADGEFAFEVDGGPAEVRFGPRGDSRADYYRFTLAVEIPDVEKN